MQDRVTLLLVDDEPRNLNALESILDDPSYRLLRAEDADAALRLLLEHPVAAIVLDIKMPGMSGFELARLIKGTKKFRHIPIVFLTAHLVDDEDVLTGYGAGAVDYLTKPVNPEILRHKVVVYADLFRKTRALAELNEKLEARVAERTAELERASRMKDEFLATVSHELRTPLNAILGWASLLKGDPAPEMVRRGLEVIERNARAQERLVSDLLDVSRIISGKMRLNAQRFALVDSIHGAVDVVRNAASAKGVHLVCEVDPALGDSFGDPERIQQVAWNLLANAVRHTPPGGRIMITARREGTAHVIRVADTGSGIPAEHMPHIFERFRQVDGSSTRAHSGLGLGLAIVRHLVESHGGEVRAESEGPGLGATFTVTLPAAGVADAAPEAPETTGPVALAPESSVVPADLSNLRVLVVEDDPDSLDLVALVLEDAGARAVCASGASEALAALEQDVFDVVVSDIGMPEMDGYALMERIRSKWGRDIAAVALSAYARVQDVECARSAGYHEHLAKPVDPSTLVETVHRVARAVKRGDDPGEAPMSGKSPGRRSGLQTA